METARTIYKGDLRTEIVHLKSGSLLVTDAPVDNKGRGEKFSPTDLVAASLGSCIFTIMGIAARENGFSIDGSSCTITKVMAENPRRIAEVKIEFDFTGADYSEKQKKILEYCVRNCPVSRSLHPDINQNVSLRFR